MTAVWFYSLASVLVVSLISFIGVFTLAISIKKLSKALLFLVSFAAGALLGDSFLHLLPEVASEFGFAMRASVGALSGILVFFILEKGLSWRHCHIPTSRQHPHPVTFMNLIGDGLHNFIDGMIIVASFLVSLPLGVATTMAVILHEIPQEIGDFGILVHGGFSKRQALLFNFFSSLLAILGALFVLGFEPGASLSEFLLSFTAGGFIYIASADLIPELKKEVDFKKSAFQFGGVVLGILVMFCLKFLD